jgi:hypothetical protein
VRIPSEVNNTIVVFFFSALIASMSLYLYFYPPSREAFFETAVLSSKGTIDPHDFFLLPNSTVQVRENVTWILQVISHMPDAQYITWETKLLNDSLPGVSSALCAPSPVPSFYEKSDLLLPTESWNLTVNWRITSAPRNGNNIRLNIMTLNGVTINPLLPATNGTGYRLLFELWYYSLKTDSPAFAFPFTYEGTMSTRCWWVQVYFNVI